MLALHKRFISTLLFGIVMAAPVLAATAADQSEEYLKQAEHAAHEKQYGEALRYLNQAQDLLRRHHMEAYYALLPQAPKGWQTQDSVDKLGHKLNEIRTVGDMSVISRTFGANGHKVVLGLVVDSPSMAQKLDLLSQEAHKSKTPLDPPIGPYNVYYVPQGNGQPDNMVFVAVNKIAVVASSPTLDKATLMSFVKQIDYNALQKIN